MPILKPWYIKQFFANGLSNAPSLVHYSAYSHENTTPVRIGGEILRSKTFSSRRDPIAFAVKYEDEVLLPTAVWISRITAVGTETLISVTTREPRSEADDEDDFLMSGEWLGMLTLRGPFTLSDFHLPESSQPVPSSPEKETRWRMVALHTDPSHRGRELTKKLVNSAIDFGKEYSKTKEML